MSKEKSALVRAFEDGTIVEHIRYHKYYNKEDVIAVMEYLQMLWKGERILDDEAKYYIRSIESRAITREIMKSHK